jgi:integrase
MPIYLRGKTWCIDYTDQNDQRVRRTAGTKNKREAQELHDKIVAEVWEQKRLGVMVKPSHSWQEAVVRWLTEQSHKKSLIEDKNHLRWLHPHLHYSKLEDINKAAIDKIKAEKLKTGVTVSTVNRMLAVLRAILNRAKTEWEWIDNVPSVKSMPCKSERVRWLTRIEADRLLKELPAHLEAMARFTLETGLRESNVVNLQWSQIDMTRRCAWIHAENSKSGKAIPVSLSKEACRLISEQIGKHQLYVFTYKGEPVTRANNHAWRKALIRAGIKDFRWHDLRHTWASWHVQNGTPLNVLKELGGWSDLSIVMRYAHLSSEHLSGYADNAGLQNVTNSAQSEKRA